MSSISARRANALLDAFEVAHGRFLASPLDALTIPELLALLERYALLMGRLDALRYELASPFVKPGESRSRDGGRRP